MAAARKEGDGTGGTAEYDHLLKLLLIGDSGVGKSSLLLRFTEDKYDEQQLSTIGVDFKISYMSLDGVTVKLAIWDTAGQERFRTLTSSYYRGAQGIILVYDVGCRTSFENCTHWLQEAEKFGTVPGNVKMIVANKTDAERVVSTEEGRNFAFNQGTLFVETSAKTSANVQHAFQELVSQVLQTPALLTNTRPITTNRITMSDGPPSQQSGCSC